MLKLILYFTQLIWWGGGGVGRRGHDHMVVGFAPTYAISAYHY